MPKGLGTFPTLAMKIAGLGDVADEINKDIADGKISLDDVAGIEAKIAPHLEAYLPNDAAAVAAGSDLVITAIQAEKLMAPKIDAFIAALKAHQPATSGA